MNNRQFARVGVAILVGAALIVVAGSYAIHPEIYSQYHDKCVDLQHYAKWFSFRDWCVNYLENNPGATGQEVLDRHAEWKIQERENLLTEPVTP